MGRQPMDPLELAFRDGKVSGAGNDIVGPFTIAGQIDGDKALLTKQYVGAHRVDYPGSFDGEGTMQGLWSIYGFGGKWLIRIAKTQPSLGNSQLAIQDWP